MADVYRIGLSIMMTGNAAHGLQLLSNQLLGLHTQIGQINSQFNRMRLAIGGALGVFAGTEIGKGLLDIIKHGEKLIDQQTHLKMLGLDNAKVAEVTAKAWEISTTARGIKVDELVKSIGQMYSIVGLGGAGELAPIMARMETILASYGKPQGDLAQKIVRSSDIMGQLTDPITHQVDLPRLKANMDIWNKIFEATEGKVGPSDMLAYAKQAGPMSGSLTPEGMMTIATLIQTIGGHRAGTAVQALGRQFVGGVMAQRTAEELLRLNMIDPAKYHVKRGGHVVIDPGGIYAGDDLMQDPLKFAAAFAEAMHKKNIVDPLAQQREFYTAVGTGPAQRAAYELVRNAEQIRAERERAKLAAEVDPAYAFLHGESPTQVMSDFTNAWDNLLTAIGKEGVPEKIAVLKAFTGAFESMKQFAVAHPEGVKLALEALAVLGGSLVVGGIVAIGAALGSVALVAGGISAAAIAIGAFAALNWDKIKSGWGSFHDWVASFINSISLTSIADEMVKVGKALTEGFVGAVKYMMPDTVAMFERVGRDIVDSLKSAATFVTSNIPTLFAELGNSIVAAIRAMIDGIKNFFTGGVAPTPTAPGISAPIAPPGNAPPTFYDLNGDPIRGLKFGTPPTIAPPTSVPSVPSVPQPQKQGYNAVPPPSGGSGEGGGGAVYLDGKKVGDIIVGRIAGSMGGPVQGSALYDSTWSSPAPA